MKGSFLVLVLLSSISVFAGTCDSISGSYKTVSSPCSYSHDGQTFFLEEHQEFSVDFDLNSKIFLVDMTSNNYNLNYIADGNEQQGRPQFEGDKYVAKCENNNIKIRAFFNILKRPMITEFAFNEDGSVIYKQSFEGNNFVRVCEMDRL